MTAREPSNLKSKTPKELRKLIRELEEICALQDRAIHKIQNEVGKRWLRKRKTDDEESSKIELKARKEAV